MYAIAKVPHPKPKASPDTKSNPKPRSLHVLVLWHTLCYNLITTALNKKYL